MPLEDTRGHMDDSEEQRLRIAIFSDSALPILNGVSISIDALIRTLRDRGHSVHLFTAMQPGHRELDPNTYRFRAISTPFARNYPVAYPPFYRMLHKFRRQEFDLIHTHTPFNIGFVGLRWAESHDLPIVSTYHTLYDRYAHYIRIFPRRYLRFKIAKHTNFYYNHVDHVLTPSDAARKWLLRHSVTKPISVVPTGVPSGPLIDRAEARRSLGISPEQRILLYVGRLAKEKNLEVLFDAAGRVFEKDPTARLWLVGDGPHRAACASMARAMGIGDRVRFAGFVPRAEVDQFYAASDLFVFSSITETQGLVVVEAMNYGLPAVAVVGGGASEPIKDGFNGYVAKNDPQALAKKVLTVLSDDRKAARLSEGAVATARKFGPDAMADRVLEVYRSVLREKRGEKERSLVHG